MRADRPATSPRCALARGVQEQNVTDKMPSNHFSFTSFTSRCRTRRSSNTTRDPLDTAPRASASCFRHQNHHGRRMPCTSPWQKILSLIIADISLSMRNGFSFSMRQYVKINLDLNPALSLSDIKHADDRSARQQRNLQRAADGRHSDNCCSISAYLL